MRPGSVIHTQQSYLVEMQPIMASGKTLADGDPRVNASNAKAICKHTASLRAQHRTCIRLVWLLFLKYAGAMLVQETDTILHQRARTSSRGSLTGS